MRIDGNGRRARSISNHDETQRLADLLETAIQQLRTLVIALTPPDLSEGLGVALRNLAEGIFIGTPTQVTVHGPAPVHLTPQTKGNAYRILREAMVNARKHARAQHVVLDLQESDNTVTARLTDDGAGAESLHAGTGHLGMATMRARSHAEGGRLVITSTPGEGTTVTLTLPTAQPATT
jgi:signal transduction histidine kinase